LAGQHLDLHSFPTRRSSDLIGTMAERRARQKSRAHFLQIALFALGLALVLMGWNWAGWIIAGTTFLRCLERFGIARSLVLLLARSEEHTSELQSLAYLVCRL